MPGRHLHPKPHRHGAAMTLGVMVCGHGSRNRLATAEFANLAGRLAAAFPQWPLEHGYLEFATPVIRDGLDALVARGVTRILAVPGMLFAAGHAKNDIPSVLNRYAAERRVTIDYGRELGIERRMIEAAAARIRQALAAAAKPVPPADTLLVVVGRGSSDPDANSNVSKITRMLVEGFGFGWGETFYSGVTFPLVEPGLRHAVKLGFPAHRGLSLFPVHRRARQPHLPPCRPRRRRSSRHRVHQRALPQRPPAGRRNLRATASRRYSPATPT